jgi:hypothetical protein
VEDATLAQVAAVLAGALDTELPDVLVRKFPRAGIHQRDGGASDRYVGEASEAQSGQRRLESGAIVGSRASRRSTTRC